SIGIVGTGGFLLVNHKEGIGDFFEPGEEIATFRDREELQRLIRHYLSRPDVTAEMARRALERARREHTHVRRVRTLLEMVDDLK
ncbi:MAG: glycosyltransferase, partial [bacterium]